MRTVMEQNSRYSQPFPASTPTEHSFRPQSSQARFCPIQYFINLYFTLFVTNAAETFFLEPKYDYSKNAMRDLLHFPDSMTTMKACLAGRKLFRLSVGDGEGNSCLPITIFEKLGWKSQRIHINRLGYGFSIDF
jgi:hypothetical protein